VLLILLKNFIAYVFCIIYFITIPYPTNNGKDVFIIKCSTLSEFKTLKGLTGSVHRFV